MSLTDELAGIVERAREEGRAQGRAEAQEEYFGKSAGVLTAQLFAASFSAAAQGLKPHSADASQFFEREAKRMADFATPAQVQSVEPSKDATGVALSNPINAHFTRKLEPSSIKADSMTVAPASGGQAKSGEVVYDDDRTVSFEPENELSAGVTYRVTVSGAVRARGGQPLGNDYEWEFTTADA